MGESISVELEWLALNLSLFRAVLTWQCRSGGTRSREKSPFSWTRPSRYQTRSGSARTLLLDLAWTFYHVMVFIPLNTKCPDPLLVTFIHSQLMG